MFIPEIILDDLEVNLASIEVPEPLPADRWICASAMQKAIRRGRIEPALRAATALWHLDRQNFWRRICTIVAEDCTGQTDVIVSTFTAIASGTWRRRVGDLKVGLLLTRMLAESTKCRAADEVYMLLALSSRYAELRQELAHASDTLLADCVMDTSRSLPERCLGGWLLAGSRRYPADLMPMREGDLEKAKEVVRSLAVPATLTESCISVAKRTTYPLCWFVPLVWQHIQQQGDNAEIVQSILAPCPDVEGIPLIAADVYTRVGGTSYRQLQQAVPELSRFTAKQIGVMVFIIEGGLLDRFIDSPSLQILREVGEHAYAESVGISFDDYAELRERIIDGAELLNDLRRQQLQKYLLRAAV